MDTVHPKETMNYLLTDDILGQRVCYTDGNP